MTVSLADALALMRAQQQLPNSPRSPWASMEGINCQRIHPVDSPIFGSIPIPGSKSVTNRALLIAAFAEGPSVIDGLLRSDDSWWCIDTLRRLGVKLEPNGDALMIDPAPVSREAREVFIGSAGTLARFLPGLLLSGEDHVSVSASQQLMGRPVADLLTALVSLGGDIESSDGYYPITCSGGSLTGGAVTMSGSVSSQFISGVLMAAPRSQRGVQLTISDHIVQADYVRITLDVMHDFGIQVDVDDAFTHFQVAPQTYRGRPYTVEADASTASYFFALAAGSGGDIVIPNVERATLQPDIELLSVLEQMGATVESGSFGVRVVGPKQLKGGFEVDMRPMSDATLTLAALAPFADAPITIRNVAHIRHHESDRIGVMVHALRTMGIEVEEFEDGMRITPAKPQFARLDTHDDHRVAMSLAVVGALGQGVELLDPGCVSKTCPPFFELIQSIGVMNDSVDL